MSRSSSIRNVYYFVSVYLLLIFLFTIFRLILVAVEFNSFKAIPGNSALLLQAFSIGWRFDTVIACYILSLPLLALSFCSFIMVRSWKVYRIITAFVVIICLGAFFVAAADIPYFRHFSTRISAAFLDWSTSPRFVLFMVLQEPKFLVYFFVFLVFSAAFIIMHHHIRKRAFDSPELNPQSRSKYKLDLVISTILMMGLVFLGARGRLAQKSPIKPSAASFSEYPMLNQVALNADYTFMVSYFDNQKEENKALHLVKDGHALNNIIRGFNISSLSPVSPLARKVDAAGPPLRANVVVVIMESMSGRFMKHFGNRQDLTPKLDSLASGSLFFNHVYSSGYHTSAGMYATLFAYPSLLNHHPLNDVITPEFTGLGKTLKDNGYNTAYFTTHDEMFDNIGGFLRGNGYDHIYSQKDYPASQVRSALGVPDHFMFDYAVPVLNKLHSKGKPFLGVFLTASNHDPKIIPAEASGFKPKSKITNTRIVEYADWAIGHFMEKARQRSWFDSTIFVFVADHGAFVSYEVYDLSLQYFNIPLIIYSPAFVNPQTCTKTGQQLDVFPTVMGLLNLSYTNNTFGIDLRRESRPYAYFCSDEQVGCINDEFYLVYRMNGPETLYRFKNLEKRNYLEVYPQVANSMRDYAFSMLQGAQWMVKNRKTGVGN